MNELDDSKYERGKFVTFLWCVLIYGVVVVGFATFLELADHVSNYYQEVINK